MVYRLSNKNFIGKKVRFIQALRSSFPGLGLKEAKEFADSFDFTTTREQERSFHSEDYFCNIDKGAYTLNFGPESFDTDVSRRIKQIVVDCINKGQYDYATDLVEVLKKHSLQEGQL